MFNIYKLEEGNAEFFQTINSIIEHYNLEIMKANSKRWGIKNKKEIDKKKIEPIEKEDLFLQRYQV